ncbi:uncharacterized protein LOC133796226 [Humulus lupulus]|uniref:uncharacterized protein LOC133796226 n=1 Tax=Humulus lupulus TaxID=3486 RepID=UPI002B406223|nr:uncharacterized protein LOC133796226 [Humulus lupulus]
MEIRAASLASMKNIEKSVKELVTENNLRLVGLLAPHSDVRESTAGSATGGGVPEQHQDLSQPPRRAMGVTIREPSSTPRAAASPTQQGKGKQKFSKHPEPILESSDENVMSAEDPFNLYSELDPVAPASKKKGSRQHRGESSSNPPTKKARTGDPQTPVPSKETTPPPAPIDQSSPPAPKDQTLPPAPANKTPPAPAPADQTPPDQIGEALMNMALNSAKGVLTMSAGWRHSGALTAQYKKRLGEQLKASEDKHVEELNTAEAKYTKQLEAAEKKNVELLEQKAKLAEELKQHQASLTKAIEAKETYKEASLIISRKLLSFKMIWSSAERRLRCWRNVSNNSRRPMPVTWRSIREPLLNASIYFGRITARWNLAIYQTV